ncbi:MAG: ABC transporter permease [Actinobacteria bacterium]|nr:MAG: ABC transporter permease [Actinomycetota bacterium]
MTALTTSPATEAGLIPSAQMQPRGASFLTATGQAARRTLLQYLRTPQLIVLPTVTSVLFLFMFRYIFGGAITTGTRGIDYVDFLIPGFSGVAEDALSGVHDRLRSLPIPRASVLAGRSLADTALITWTLLVNLGLGYAVGFRAHAGFGSVVLAFGVMLVASLAFSWVFISVGLWAGNAQAAQGMATLWVVPLTFVSSAYVPVHSMPGWMQAFAKNQPVTAVINASRSLMLGGSQAAGVGHSTSYWVVIALAASVGILVVFGGIAVARFARTR